MQSNDRFIRGVFARYLLPTVLSVLGGTVNVMVDSVIVGNLIGAAGLAAINLCSPVFLLFATLGTLFGSGAATQASLCAGRDEEERGRRFYSLAILLELAVGALCTALGLAFLHPLAGLLGARGEAVPLVTGYAAVSFWGAVPKMLLYVPFQFLRLDGKPGRVSVMLLAMTALNGALDVAFIRLGLGMAGAALASVLATAAAVAMGFWFLRGGSFRPGRVTGAREMAQQILRAGSAPALNNLLCMLRVMLLNIILGRVGGNLLVSVFAAVYSVGEFSLCLVSGVPQTVSPLAGIYSGERDNRSLRLLMRLQFLYGGVLIAVFAVCTALFPRALCALFGLRDPWAAALAAPAFRLFALSLIPAMAASIFIFFYNAVGRYGLASLITVCRVFVFAVGPAALLARTGRPGLVWWFYPVSEILALAVMFACARAARRRNPMLSGVLLLDETLEREGKTIDFSVENSIESVMDASVKIGSFCEENAFTARQTMAVSLSIEEMLTIILQHCFTPGSDETVDVRVFAVQSGLRDAQGGIGLRIRNGGRQFSPIDYCNEHGDGEEAGETLGIRMITSIAESVRYQRTFGVNTLTILL